MRGSRWSGLDSRFDRRMKTPLGAFLVVGGLFKSRFRMPRHPIIVGPFVDRFWSIAAEGVRDWRNRTRALGWRDSTSERRCDERVRRHRRSCSVVVGIGGLGQHGPARRVRVGTVAGRDRVAARLSQGGPQAVASREGRAPTRSARRGDGLRSSPRRDYRPRMLTFRRVRPPSSSWSQPG
jgi:hypothetical protein